MNPTPQWLEKLIKLPDIDVNLKTFGGHKQRVKKGWKSDYETHFAFEIMLIIDGVQTSEFTGRQMDFYQGDLILIPPGTPHKNKCTHMDGLEYFCMHFDLDDPEIQQQLLMYCPILLNKSNPHYKDILEILYHYISILDKNQFDMQTKIYIEILLLQLMSNLLSYVEKEKSHIDSSSNTTLVLSKEIAEVIQQNFRLFTVNPTDESKDLLSMEKIALSLNMSSSTMLKTFKKVYGISPKQYLDQLRFNQSKYLLHQPNLSITDISHIIGFQNSSHFTRQFKKWANMSPKEYRIVRYDMT